MTPNSERSRSSPRPGLFSSPRPRPIFSIGLAMLFSDNEASIDPSASSTSGKEMIDEFEAEEGMESSEPEEGKELCDSNDGREGNDSNGGEGGEGGSGSDGASSTIGRETCDPKGEKSRLTSMLGNIVGGSRIISSISSIFTDSSKPPDILFRRGGIHAPWNSSELSCGVAGMMFSIGTFESGMVAVDSVEGKRDE